METAPHVVTPAVSFDEVLPPPSPTAAPPAASPPPPSPIHQILSPTPTAAACPACGLTGHTTALLTVDDWHSTCFEAVCDAISAADVDDDVYVALPILRDETAPQDVRTLFTATAIEVRGAASGLPRPGPQVLDELEAAVLEKNFYDPLFQGDRFSADGHLLVSACFGATASEKRVAIDGFHRRLDDRMAETIATFDRKMWPLDPVLVRSAARFFSTGLSQPVEATDAAIAAFRHTASEALNDGSGYADTPIGRAMCLLRRGAAFV